MIAKRVAAAVAAVAMIIVAFAIRSSPDRPPTPAEPVSADATATTATTITGQDRPALESTPVTCAPDLADACYQAAARMEATTGETATITIVDVDATLADPANAPLAWVTLASLPDAIETADPSIVFTSTPVAQSPLALIVTAERADVLTAACGTVVEWRCLGDHAGRPWDDIDGDASWSTVRPGFSPASTAIGALSITAAVRSYFGPMSITAADPAFLAWGRQLGGAVSASTLSTGSAVGTIQVRPSSLDIAVGSPAELARADDPRFALVPVGDDVNATVVVATRDGSEVPPEFVDALRDEFVGAGWEAVTAANATYDGGDVIAALDAWNDVQ